MSPPKKPAAWDRKRPTGSHPPVEAAPWTYRAATVATLPAVTTWRCEPISPLGLVKSRSYSYRAAAAGEVRYPVVMACRVPTVTGWLVTFVRSGTFAASMLSSRTLPSASARSMLRVTSRVTTGRGVSIRTSLVAVRSSSPTACVPVTVNCGRVTIRQPVSVWPLMSKKIPSAM